MLALGRRVRRATAAVLGAASCSMVHAQGFQEWRVGSTFEALIGALGVPVQASALGGGFDIERCTLAHDKLYALLQPGFDAMLTVDDSASAARRGVRFVGAALRSFSKSCERCSLAAVADRLKRAADEAGTLTASDVRWERGGLSILFDDVNVSSPMRGAARAWFRERYDECGASLAAVVRAVAPVAEAHEGGFGGSAGAAATGSGSGSAFRTEREYVEHLRAEWTRAQQLLREAEQAAARPWQGPRMVAPFQQAAAAAERMTGREEEL